MTRGPAQTVKLHRDWIDYTVASMAVLGVVAGGLAFAVAYLEYDHVKHNSMVIESLNYVARFKSGPLLDATKKMGALLSTNEATAILDNWKDEQDFYRRTARFNSSKSHNMEFEIRLLTDFFDELYVCAAQEICDEDLSIKLLGFDIINLHVWTNSSVKQVADSKRFGPGFGCGFNALYTAASRQEKMDRAACPQLVRENRARA